MKLLIGTDMWGTIWIWEEYSTRFMCIIKTANGYEAQRRNAADCISFIGRVKFKDILDKYKEEVYKMWSALWAEKEKLEL